MILIDESQIIKDKDTLEEIRLFLNFQLNNKFLITLILVGQPELLEKMIESSMAAARKVAVVSDEEFAAYIDTIDGLAMSVWLALDRRYPKKFSRDDVLKIVGEMDRQEQERLFRVRDQAAGMDSLGNSTGRTPE